MRDSRADLFARFIAGGADADAVRRIGQALEGDPAAADALLAEARLDVHLREILSGSVLGDVSGTELEAARVTARNSFAFWLAAAMFPIAIAGWCLAAYSAIELASVRDRVGELGRERAELEGSPARQHLETSAVGARRIENNVPEIHSVRGWLMAPSKSEGGEGAVELLEVGATPPLETELRTCPWGASEFRYGGGVSVTVERNTVLTFHETENRRQLTLERGIAHLTSLSKTDRRPTELRCSLATVRVVHGQVAVQVDARQTIVEGARGEVDVRVRREGNVRSFRVRRGEYLVIKSGEEPKVTEGILNLGLEVSKAKRRESS